MEEQNKLSAAVVGTGAGGMLSVRALINSPEYDLVAVADVSPVARERFQAEFGDNIAFYTSADDLLDKSPTDVVCVSTYAPTHLPVTVAALESGVKGLLVEKPLGDTTAAGQQVLHLLSTKNIPFVVPHGLMAQRASTELIARVRDGLIGTLRFVEMECSGWDTINAGIHWIQFFVDLVNPAKVEMVLAGGDSSTRTYRDGMQVETEAVVMARCDNGVRLYLNTGDQVPIPADTVCLIRLIGTSGVVEYEAYSDRYSVLAGSGAPEEVVIDAYTATPHQRHLDYLAYQIREGIRDYRIPEESLASLEVVEAAYESIRVGGAVRIPINGAQPDRPSDWDPGRPYSGFGGGVNGRAL